MAGRGAGGSFGRRPARSAESAGADSADAKGAPEDPETAARDLCLRLLTGRARSRAELATALARKEVPADVADRVLDRLGDVGLVDDAAYAAMVVRSGHEHRSLGRRAISAELRRRGVEADTAGAAMVDVDAESEERTAAALVERKLRAMTKLDDPTKIRRLVGMLARKGYSQGLAYRVVRETLREHGSDVEFSDPEHVT